MASIETHIYWLIDTRNGHNNSINGKSNTDKQKH